jgi:hypothetical protein
MEVEEGRWFKEHNVDQLNLTKVHYMMLVNAIMKSLCTNTFIF